MLKNVDETIDKLESVFSANITDIQQLKDKLGGRKLEVIPELPERHSREVSCWEEHFSEEYQIPYYFNPQTGESSWEVPADFQSGDETTIDIATLAESIHLEQHGFQRLKTTVVNSRDKQQQQQQPTIAERSVQQIQARKEREDSYREYLERKSLEEIKSKPVTTNKSKLLQRDVNDMLSWEENRKAKIAQRQQEASQEISAQNTGRPKLTKVAEKLAQNHQQLPVEERLLDYEVF